MGKLPALIVVDVQKDFCPGGSLAVPNGDEVVAPLNKILDLARRQGWVIVASRDFHPEKTTHFAQYGGTWPPHCVWGTDGAEFHPDLNLDYAIVVTKGMGAEEDTDSYSAFGARLPSGVKLAELLKSLEVDEVYVGGLATDYCVKATAIDAAKYGFTTWLFEDACRAVNINPDDGTKALDEMSLAGVKITSTDNFVKQS